jgi:hypothetical protein
LEFPKFIPSKVMDPPPVVGRLRSNPVTTGASNENPESMVPGVPVMVTDCAILLLVAWLVWHASTVLVTHEVVLQDARRCTVGELLFLAKFRPYTVTLVPPDSAPFLPTYESPPDRANDTTGASKVK